MANDWSALDHAERDGHFKATQDATKETPGAPKASSPTRLPEGNTYSPAGVAEAQARRSVLNHARAVLKAAYVFPDEQVRPLSYQWPASFGEPTSIYPIIVHGLRCYSYHFRDAPTVKRCAVKVQGYDD